MATFGWIDTSEYYAATELEDFSEIPCSKRHFPFVASSAKGLSKVYLKVES